MKYLLDANICILLLAGHARVVAQASLCDAGDLGVSAIAFAEVALGSRLGKHPPVAALDLFLDRIALIDFDERAARQYARLPFKRGSFDRLIAAHALSLNLILVTANERDFADIPDLKVVNWTT